MKLFFTFFIISLSSLLISCDNAEGVNPDLQERDSTVYTLVEEMPIPPGGDKETFSATLEAQINYPQEALKENIEGIVYLEFVIDLEGNLIQEKVLTSKGYGLDEEALRLIRTSPDWTPGKHHGEPKFVITTLPINFEIEK